GQVLAILVTAGGQVENKLFKADLSSDPSFLERVNNYLNERIAGKTLEEIRLLVLEELGAEKDRVDELAAQALRLGRAAFQAGEGATPAIIVAGQAHLLDSSSPTGVSGQSADDRVARLQRLLGALEEKESIVR